MTKNFMSLKPFELLNLAMAIESSNSERYHEWADRFRPYDEDASDFLDEMGDRDDQHHTDLQAVYAEEFGSTMEVSDMKELNKHTEDAEDVEKHFFVIDDAMAHSILTAALHTLYKARRAYQAILIRTKNTLLRKAYEPRTLSDAGSVKSLKQLLHQYKSRHTESS